MGWDISTDADANGGKVIAVGSKAAANGELLRFDELKQAPGVLGDVAGYDAGGRLQFNDPVDPLDGVNKQFYEANLGTKALSASTPKSVTLELTGTSVVNTSHVEWEDENSFITLYRAGSTYAVHRVAYATGVAEELLSATNATATNGDVRTGDLYVDGLNISVIVTAGSTTISYSKSTDGGANWTSATSVAPGVTGFIKAVRFLDHNTVFIVSTSGTSTFLYKSTDGGANWTSQGSFTGNVSNTSIVDLVPLDANTIYVGYQPNGATGFRIVKTTNGGSTWGSPADTTTAFNPTEYRMFLNGTKVLVFVYANTGGILLYESTDAGASFSLKTTVAYYGSSQTLLSQSYAQRGDLIYLFHFVQSYAVSRLSFSNDGGNTWETDDSYPLHTGYLTFPSACYGGISPSGDRVAFVGSGGTSNVWSSRTIAFSQRYDP